jgi:hypothetical protein
MRQHLPTFFPKGSKQKQLYGRTVFGFSPEARGINARVIGDQKITRLQKLEEVPDSPVGERTGPNIDVEET